MHEPSLPEAMTSADLVKELSANASLLVQRQVKLAKLEAKQELQKAQDDGELIGAAWLCAYGGALFLLVAAACRHRRAALGGHLWAGALVVAGVLFVPAAFVGVMGWRKRA